MLCGRVLCAARQSASSGSSSSSVPVAVAECCESSSDSESASSVALAAPPNSLADADAETESLYPRGGRDWAGSGRCGGLLRLSGEEPAPSGRKGFVFWNGEEEEEAEALD